MPDFTHAFAHPATVLMLETFRLNGAFIALGDAVAAPVGLTSARWQVMGAIAEAQGALPVASLARNMGLVRQSVQRTVDELTALGLLRLTPNPHHKRARLVGLTDRGVALFEEVCARWLAVGEPLLAGIGAAEAERGAAFLRTLRARVEALHPANSGDHADRRPSAPGAVAD